MDNIKTDIMKAKEYIKNQYKELEDRYKNSLEDCFDERDTFNCRGVSFVKGDLKLYHMGQFQILASSIIIFIQEIQAMQCRDEFLLDSEISVIISRLKIIVADCLIKEYALRYELDERDKNNDE